MSDLELHEFPKVVATLASNKDRNTFLSKYLGASINRGTQLIYEWMGKLSKDYDGSEWDFYHLSNGSFYIAPNYLKSYNIKSYSTNFNGVLSADAAGILATLFALKQLLMENLDTKTINLYHDLKDFVYDHPEIDLILKAIDGVGVDQIINN